jgi:hypothetical protein
MPAQPIQHIIAARVTQARRDAHPVTAITQKIISLVGDPNMNHAIPLKAAQAVHDGRLSQGELVEILNSLDHHRRAGTLRSSSGAYFCGALQRAFARNQIPWTPTPP